MDPRSRAKEAGYSDEEIDAFEASRNKSTQAREKAKEAGYSDEEIKSFESKRRPSNESEAQRLLKGSQNLKEGLARLPAQAVSGAAKFATFGTELIHQGAKALENTNVNKAKVNKENAIAMMEHLYEKKAVAGIGNAPEWTDEDELELDTLREIAQFQPEEFEGSADVEPTIPSPHELIEKVPGFKAEGYLDEIFQLYGGLRKGAFLKNFGIQTMKKAAPHVSNPYLLREVGLLSANLPIAATAVAIKDQTEIPEWMTLTAMALGKYGWEKVLKPGAAHYGKKYAAYDPTKISAFEPIKTAKQEAANNMQNAREMVKDGLITPEQFQQVRPYMQTAAEYGFPITYGSVTDSKYFKRVEDLMLKDNLSQPEIQSLRQKAAKAQQGALNVALSSMKQNLNFESPGGVSEALATNVTKRKYKTLTNLASNGYKESANLLKDSPGLNPDRVQQIETAFNNVYEEIGNPLLKGETRQSVQNIVQAGANRLTESPNQAGRPELQNVEFATGNEAVARRASAESKKIQETIDDIPRLEKEAKKAEKELRKLQAKHKREEQVAKATPALHGEPVKTQRQLNKEKSKKKAAVKEAEQKQIATLQAAIDAPAKAREQIKLSKEKVEKTKLAKNTMQEEASALFEQTIGEELGSVVRLNPETGKIEFVNKNINGRVLIDTLKAINERLDFANPNVMNMLQGPKKVINQILDEEYGKTHPRAVQQYRRANRLYGERERLFGDDSLWQKWGLTQNVLPEDLLKTLSTLDRVKQFEKDFPQSKELMQYFKRLVVEDKLKPVFNKATYNPGQMAGDITALENDRMFQYMIPEEVKHNLQEIKALDLHLERTASKFFSNTAPTQENLTMQSVFNFVLNPGMLALKLGARIGKENLAKVYSQILSDPHFTEDMITIGQEALDAAQSGNIPKLRMAKKKGEIFLEEVVSMGEMIGNSSLK